MSKPPVIIQFDGDDNYHTVADLVMFNMDLEIAARAKGLKSARDLFKKIEDKKLTPEVALVSGFLGRDQGDGRQVVKKLRQLAPNIKVIAYTVDPEADWGDELAIKSHTEGEHTLIKTLERVTGHTFKGDNAEDPETMRG